MKKLMIIAAFACATMLSRGASVEWSATATSAYNGQKMYLLTEMLTSYASADALEAAAVDVATVTKAGPKYSVATRTADDDAITKTSNFYLAVIDATDKTTVHYVDVTSTMQPYVYAPPESKPGTFSTAFATVATSANTATIGVPEPTSGILMLVGLGALALRRRRA